METGRGEVIQDMVGAGGRLDIHDEDLGPVVETHYSLFGMMVDGK